MKQSKWLFFIVVIVLILVIVLISLVIQKKPSPKVADSGQPISSQRISSQISSDSKSSYTESSSSEVTVNLAELNQVLLEATSQENLPEIQQLLANGASVDTVNEKGESGLLVATHRNNVQMAELFLTYHANVNLQDEIQDSPFLYAGAEGRTEILTKMVSHQPNTRLTNRFGGNALIPAAEKGHLENVRLLLEKTDVEVNHINTPGWTALLEAIVYTNGDENQQQIIQTLLDYGADPNLADSQGVTPIQHAKKRGFQEIVSILQKAGATE